MTQREPGGQNVFRAALVLLIASAALLVLAVVLGRAWVWTAAITFTAFSSGMAFVGWSGGKNGKP